MLKRVFVTTLAFLSILNSIWVPPKVEAAGTLPTTQDKSDPNKHYFVALFSSDIWRRSDGVTWTGDGSPGGPVNITFPYSFDFPGRKIKSVQVDKFKDPFDWDNGLNIWNKSRYNSMDWASTADFMSNNFNSVQFGSLTKIGTSTVSFKVQVKGYLTTSQPGNIGKDITDEGGGGLGDGVIGYRYYFPSMLTIELEPEAPEEGQAIIKHFTTTGQSLDGVEGFTDRTEKLVKDRPYSYSHTPGTTNYEYKGYQKSTQSEPIGGPNATGDPPRFTYNGDFPIYYIYFYYEKKGGPPDIPTGGCTRPTPSGNVIDVPLNDPSVSAVIKADSRGSERFNVLDGIPTSESLYGNVLAKSYLHQNKFVEMSGKCTYNITVNRTYTLTWDPGKTEIGPDKKPRTVPDPQTDTETVTKSYPVERDYSFWVIDNLEVYQINEATLQNYAFEGNGIRVQPSGYVPPSYATAQSGGFTAPSPSTTVEAPPGSKSGGKERPDVSGENLESFAQDEVKKVKVKNDTLTFNGGTVMSGAVTQEKGPRPGQIPVASQIGQNVLYSPGNVIPISKTNKANQTSSGTIYYGVMSGNINGGADQSFPIYGINSVTVHTPVVIYPSVSDDRAHNQKTKPAAGRSAIILDRPFTVEMPNSGQHANYLGYGHRNYLKYIGSKQVRFPFDVYDGAKTAFYPKNTWIEVDKSKESFAFFLPVWVDEGFYSVEFRTIAHNAPAGATQQTNANLDLAHHIAYDTVPVDAIGRVYDFRITDIADYNWESVFRVRPGSSIPNGTSYWVGQNGIDGAARGNATRYTLPIRPGSHPLYKNAVIKTGYHFKFDLKTKGNMFGPQDQIVITPAFDFINASTGKRVAVDLYYNTGSSKFVRIGSASDKVQRYVILNERLRNVPNEEMTDTALYKYDHEYTFNQVAGIGRSQFVQNFIQKWAKQKTPVGSFGLLRLPEGIRTLIGPKVGIPSGVDMARVNAAVQKWYGEYSLPADLYAVASGTNVAEYGRTHGGLTDKSPIFLKNGYIVVNFNIETIQNGEVKSPYLQYINAPLMNQWHGMEGFTRTVRDPYGRTFSLRDGDVVFYHADKSSRDDFRSTVTH